MTSQKIWVPKGTYDNLETNRRETYDGKGNVIESQGCLYADKHPAHFGKFGRLPNIPARPETGDNK